MSVNVYWIFWFGLTLIHGLIAGFMIGYVLFLGRFLSWTVEFPEQTAARKDYVSFRTTKGRTGILFLYILSALQTIFGITFLVVSIFEGKSIIIAAVGGLAGVLWQGIYFLSGFKKSEKNVISASAILSKNDRRNFLHLNIPLHILFATISLVAFILLLNVPSL